MYSIIVHLLTKSNTSSSVLSNVLRKISDISEWFPLGASLGLRVHTLTTIRQTHVTDPGSCKAVMLEKWLQGMDDVSVVGGPSWQQLADVLENLGHVRRAKKIRKDYC